MELIKCLHDNVLCMYGTRVFLFIFMMSNVQFVCQFQCVLRFLCGGNFLHANAFLRDANPKKGNLRKRGTKTGKNLSEADCCRARYSHHAKESLDPHRDAD